MIQTPLALPTNTMRPTFYQSYQHGFTLVELVMVIVLLAIISTMALPRFFNTSPFDERVLFDDTLNAVRYAQKVAVASGCNIRFSVNNNRYSVFKDNSCNSGNFSSNIPVKHPANSSENYTGTQNTIALTAIHTHTIFDALGRADNDNTISVGSRRISIIAATGFSYDSTP